MNSIRRGTLAAALVAALVVTTGAAADAKPPKRADLVVNSIAVVSGVPHPGAALTIRDATANVGAARATKSSTAIFLSKDAKRDKGDTKLGRRKLQGLEAGRSSTGLSVVALPKGKGAAPGSYRLIACADARQAVSERNEANNCAVKPIAITTVPAKPGKAKLAYLKLYPPAATVGATEGIILDWAVWVQELDATSVTYTVEGYDSAGHDLGDYTSKAALKLADGSCSGATCYPLTAGTRTVTASVGAAAGTASITGVSPKMVCPGERYDVDNDGEDCEEIQSFKGHTAARYAKSIGARSCYDGPTDASFQGTMLSDSREHRYPAVEGFDRDVGSAPAWRSLLAIGGQCVNDIKMTVKMTGGGSQQCYRVSMKFAKGPDTLGEPNYYRTYVLDLAGNETRTRTTGPGSYEDNTKLYFEIEKTCSASVREKVSYTVSYHL